MTKFKNFLIFILPLLILTLSSCVPASNTRTGTKSSTDSSEEDTDSSDDTSTDSVAWYAGAKTITGTLSQNASEVSSFYLRGTSLSNYIINKSKTTSTFCVVSSFNSLSSPALKQLRLKAVPFKLLNSSEYALKIYASSSSDNKSFCGGDSVPNYSSSDAVSTYISEANAAFTYNELCPTCTQVFLSDSIKLFESANGSIGNGEPISTTSLNLTSLRIKIDVTNNQTTETNTCSLASCQADGYDCCLDGQCVKDGTLKPNPDSTNLAAALYDVSLSYSNFKKWPTVYFVCQENTSSDDDTTADTDAQAKAEEELNTLLGYYYCLQGDTTKCSPDLTTVQQTVWKMCGCLMDPITNEALDPRCPDYTLQTVTNTAGSIINVECLIPEEEQEGTPFQDLNVNISARSAPHRFYNSAGKTYDTLSDVPAGEEQEGEEFMYLDETNKIGAVSSAYNINAVLGNMSLALDEAQPAVEIDVELDQSYIISGNSGYYSPCPTCQKDSWYTVFSSHPEVANTFGLSFRNYSTSRSSYDYNVNNGNYEDTIFGRACWVPPTMIPFTHKTNTDLKLQRRNRLSAQAALFVNGYQRDWYGFNKGALIASFDGVNWFAVGNGRRVQSTSTKLFLAINAPFADIADQTSYSVSVIQDLGGQTASNYDWDFEKGFSDSGQNPGASCQYMHQCEVDSDCVTKLGWEYACADVSGLKTTWPKFDIDANEKVNSAQSNISIGDILISGLSGDSQKRCVYRGSGSLCKVDNSTTLTSNQLKLLTCAPNFYCASLSSSSFNREVKRSVNDPTNISYGQGANILGRPQKYVGATYSLTTDIRDNILNNLTNFPTPVTVNDYGICVPGRSTTATNVSTAHKTKDSSYKTDYISQIGGCNSSLTTTSRTLSCPTFDDDGNLIRTGAVDLITTNLQNSCGAASQTSAGVSAFAGIEFGTLNQSGLTISTAGFAKDACFRRPGSVCHTNLDCAPNYLHAEQAATKGLSYFGGTLAEFELWTEELVCGQGDSKPIFGSSTSDYYSNYDMGENRCCREISKDFTMYTELSGTKSSELAGYDSQNTSLNTNTFTTSSTYGGPTATGRYSRYLASDSSIKVAVSSSTLLDGSSITQSQWKPINDAGTKNCCGGGFVRKFEDGTTNWNIRNRFKVSPENFACLNYSTRLYKEAATTATEVKKAWTSDYGYLCLYPSTNDDGSLGGCIQNDIEDQDLPYSSYTKPTTFTPGTGLLSTYPGTDFNEDGGNIDLQNMISDSVIYPPIVYKNTSSNITNDLLVFRNPSRYVDGSTGAYDHVVTFYLPSYITTPASINAGTIKYTLLEDSSSAFDRTTPTAHAGSCDPVTLSTTAAYDATGAYCSGTANGRVYMMFYAGLADATWKWGYLQFNFTQNYPAGTLTPGSAQFYESILSKFELLGVPQVSYEYLVCNDSTSAANLTVVPGLYKATEIASTSAAIDGSTAVKAQFSTKGSTISHSQIFASNDFRCCAKVGSKVDATSRCCSGYGEKASSDTLYTCKLPAGTDLHLYLNKFISSEGDFQLDDADDDSEKLLETDFDAETGYPSYTTKVYTLIQAFGEANCSSGATRQGGAFGNFGAQPGTTYDSSRYSIVDSPLDYDSDTGAGYAAFVAGYHWNLHLYCQ